MSNNILSLLRDELIKLLAPITSAASLQDGAAALVQIVGHVGDLGQDPDIQAEFKRLAQLIDDIAGIGNDGLSSFEEISQLLGLSGDLMTAVRGIESVLNDPALALSSQNLGRELSESLFALYLRTYYPHLFRTAVLLAQITPVEGMDPEPMVVDSGAISRLPWERDKFHFERISQLTEDPFRLLKQQYLPGEMVRAQDAYLAAARLFPIIRDLAKSLDLGWIYDLPRVGPDILIPDSDTDDSDVLGPWPPDDDMLTVPVLSPFDLSEFQRDYRPRFAFYLPGDNEGEPAVSKIGLFVIASAKEHPDEIQGYLIGLIGDINWTEIRGDWRLELLADGSIPAFVIGPDGVNLAPPATNATGATAKFVVEKIVEPGGPAFMLGAPDGTRIELGAFRLNADLNISPERQAISLSMEANSGVLVLVAGETDGFLNALLPGNGARAEFDFGLILSSDRGFEIKGGVGLDLLLTPRLTFGPVVFDAINLNLGVRKDDIQLRINATLGVKLGPVFITVAGLGMQVTTSFSTGRGNFGPLGLDMGLLSPSGAGITIDAGPITGGGFLQFDPENGRYAGALELEIYDISVKAIGLLDTQIPGGKPAYSFLILISTEFSPVPIGFGFTLNGVGGLAGIQRRMVVKELRTRLRQNSLDHILFPENPIRDAAQIVSDLQTVSRRGRQPLCLWPDGHYRLGPARALRRGAGHLVGTAGAGAAGPYGPVQPGSTP